MPPVSPIDFAATRKGLVQAIAQATGLPTRAIIREQGGGPVQPPPPRPYCSFLYRSIGMRAGQDAVVPAPDLGPTTYRYQGERGISVDFNFHADDQDEAYGLTLLWQIGLEQQPIRETLETFGMTVWTVGDATNVTALLNTGFEARGFVEAELWLSTEVVVDLGSMDSVTVEGLVVRPDDTIAIESTTTVSAGEGT